jgi:structure-specific recognition protein 1
MASSDEEVVAERADRGSADEDEESVDEDFRTDTESDVAEEYDSAHESSGSDEEMADDGNADAGGDSDPPEVERPKKKAKTTK